MKKSDEVSPFLKWAGGKQGLVNQLKTFLPEHLPPVYVEPFLGSGAFMFWMLNNTDIQEYYAGDNNPDLINLYSVIKSELVGSLISELSCLVKDFRLTSSPGGMFLEIRNEFNNRTSCTDEVRRAALMLFLNKTCFNGLYRVNNSGRFNVPYGKRQDVTVYDPNLLIRVHTALKKVTFFCCRFNEMPINESVLKNSLFYFDPPYRPLSQTSGFTKYTKDSFDEKEHIELAEYCQWLSNAGALWMLSNSDTSARNENDSFYKDYFLNRGFKINKVSAQRLLSASAKSRGYVSEVLITNY